MNSNFPKDDDLIRRAARNVRQNNEEPEPSFKDASDDQVARQKADFEKDEPPDDDVQVVCGSIDKDGKVHEVPADEIPDSVRAFIDDLTDGAFSKRNPPKAKLPRKPGRSRRGVLSERIEPHNCTSEELAEIEKELERVQELCVKHDLPGMALLQISNTFWGAGFRGFRCSNKRSSGKMDLFMKIGDVLFSDTTPRPEDLKDLCDVVSRMLKYMKGGSSDA